MLSGCAITKSLPDSLIKRQYGEAKDWIEKGVDVNAVDERQNTPLCYSSARYDYCNEAKYGYTLEREKYVFLCEGTVEEQLDVLTLLIRKGAKVNSVCGTLGNPLLAAIYYNNIDAVRLLISNGADVNLPTLVKVERGPLVKLQRDASSGFGFIGGLFPHEVVIPNDGKTPLMHAYSFGYTEIAQLLLINGANPSLKTTKAGKTAKDYYNAYLERKRIEDAELAQQQQAAYEQRQRDKAESREVWKGIATLGVGIAVGNASRNLAPDQQERMMRSSMQGVQSGDMSEFNATTQQVKAERTQEHNTKMQAIEAQKEREYADAKEAEAANNRRMMDASMRSHQPGAQNTTNRQQPPVQPWNNQAQGNSGVSQQDQERQRKELQAQLAANQQGRNRNEEQLQQQSRVQPRNPPSLASVSNSGRSRNSSDQQVSTTPEQSTAATKTVTAEGDSQTCHARPIAESQARLGAELDGRSECEALGKGWGLDSKIPRFAGYLSCTPCTSRWEQGNFRCKVTQAMYNCKHR